MAYKIITIAQQKGGAGKTTIAAHLATAFSQKGKRVVAIDIDPQGSFTRWHQIREEKYGEDYTGMKFLTISGWRLPSELDSIKRNADVIIIDSPPHTQTETKTAIRAADLVIIPAQPSPTDLWATQETISLASSERVPHRVLMNRIVPRSRLTKEISEEFPVRCETALCNRVSFASSMYFGQTVTEFSPSSPASQEIRKLVDEVEGLLFPAKVEEEAVA